MAVLGLRLSGAANAVSKLHGVVSRRMFASLWPGVPTDEIPVAAVTNGSYHQVSDRGALADVSKTINLHFAFFTQYTEVSAIFVAAAALLLAVGALISVLWFGRVV